MNAATKAAIEAKVAAIQADPLAWARADEEAFLATMGSMARYAKRASDEQLATNAARELAQAKALLAEAGPDEEAIDVGRLERANERTHQELG